MNEQNYYNKQYTSNGYATGQTSMEGSGIKSTYQQNNYQQTTYNQQNMNSQQSMNSQKPYQTNNMADPNFVFPDEKLKAVLGQGAVTSLVTGDGWAKREVMLTDKHLYYIHSKGIVNIESESDIVAVEDITGTKILNYNPYLYLIFGCLGIFFIIVAMVQDIDMDMAFACSIIGWCLIPFFILYFIYKKKYLQVCYAGGNIQIKLHSYKMEDVIVFQKMIYAAKRARK